MDPLSSLGVAGNVIQFVDFGTKLVSRFKQIYRSADGALQENTELSELATRLKVIADPLERSSQTSHRELHDIALKCRHASDELLELLAGLRNQANRHRKLSAVRITLKSVMKEGVIKDLDSKIQRLQQQLNMTLLTLLHSSNGLLTAHIAEIIDSNQKFRLDTKVSLEKLIYELENLQKLGQNVIYLPDIGHQIDTLTEESKLAGKRRRILKSLRYNIMYDRFEDVVEAYDRTFQWVLNDPALGFSGWLKSGSARTYWITGKPGSGKSTLMKYVHQQPRTRELLREWAGSHRLIIANHFFWVSGDQLQRRQIGLLRSLLFQILRECPLLIESVCETRWNEDELTWDEPWNLRTLSSCFDRLANNEALDAKICLFIDGLDEYDGDHRELIQVLRNLMRSSKSQLFKLCVSSRPWNVFEAEYGGLLDKLRVHELTSNDILSYVDCNLHEDRYLRELFAAAQHQSSDLIQVIAKKAQGVFLWVHYVVRLLLKTAVDRPTMVDLVKMVDDYPDELDPLFERILATIPKVYHRHTAQMIQICLESTSPPPLVVLWFAERGIENEDYSLQREISELTREEFDDVLNFKQRLKGKCMDFIEVQRKHSLNLAEYYNIPQVYFYQVEFFHRTVRDFLHMKKGWINEWAGETFDVHLAMCRASLGQFKTLPSSTMPSPKMESQVNIDLFASGLHQFFAAAHISETERGLPIGNLLEQLDDVLRIRVMGAEPSHWSSLIAEILHQSDGFPTPLRNTDLLSVAVQTGLLLYVRENIRPKSRGWSGRLLHQALVADPSLVGFSALNPEVIRHLLECGADPNERYSDQSAWCEFLLRCFRKHTPGYQCLDSACVETIEILLQYGANTEAVCYIGSPEKHRQITGKESSSISVEEILSVYPDNSHLLTLLAKARERIARRQHDTRSGHAEPRIKRSESRKRKRRWRVWAYLKQFFN